MAVANERDGAVWDDDAVELVLEGDESGDTAHFIINPSNVVYDRLRAKAGDTRSRRIPVEVRPVSGRQGRARARAATAGNRTRLSSTHATAHTPRQLTHFVLLCPLKNLPPVEVFAFPLQIR